MSQHRARVFRLFRRPLRENPYFASVVAALMFGALAAGTVAGAAGNKAPPAKVCLKSQGCQKLTKTQKKLAARAARSAELAAHERETERAVVAAVEAETALALRTLAAAEAMRAAQTALAARASKAAGMVVAEQGAAGKNAARGQGAASSAPASPSDAEHAG